MQLWGEVLDLKEIKNQGRSANPKKLQWSANNFKFFFKNKGTEGNQSVAPQVPNKFCGPYISFPHRAAQLEAQGRGEHHVVEGTGEQA